MASRIRQQLRFLRKLGPPSYNSNNHHHRFVFYCEKNEMASPIECINPVAVWILRFATLPLCNNRFSSWIPVRRFLHSVQEISSISSSSSSTKLVLYSYWQSSCSWRVRFALNLKGFPYEYRAVDLSKGEQFSPEFECLNPLHFVPALVDGDVVVSDSFAILLYLEEKYPQNSLLPVDPTQKSVNLQVASIVSSGIQPLQMMSVLKYIGEKVGPDEALSWAQHHIEKGFVALEKLLKDFSGRYATGDEVFLADIFLAPQINNAIVKFNIDMSKFPTLSQIYEAYEVLPAFQASLPERQPDAII